MQDELLGLVGTEFLGYMVRMEIFSYRAEFVIQDGDGEAFLRGHVKWDGCSNWHFDAQDEVMLHFCDQESLENVGKLMSYCYELAEANVPKFCG